MVPLERSIRLAGVSPVGLVVCVLVAFGLVGFAQPVAAAGGAVAVPCYPNILAGPVELSTAPRRCLLQPGGYFVMGTAAALVHMRWSNWVRRWRQAEERWHRCICQRRMCPSSSG